MKFRPWFTLVFALPSALAAQGFSPYAPDAATVILYHMDESAGATVVTDAAGHFPGVSSAGETPWSVFDGANGITGFGAAGNNMSGTGIGIDANLDGVFRFDDNVSSPDRFDALAQLGAAFTLEAMIRVGSITTGSPQHLWGLDGSASRALQFRINGDGVLNFDPIDGGGAPVTFNLPSLTGPHAFVPNKWFHVAAVYDDGEVSLYWTRVDSGAAVANRVAVGTSRVAFQSDDSPLVFGNEGRSIGGMGEGLVGLLDEGRVSRIARADNEFIFDSVALLGASSYEGGSTNDPAKVLDGDLGTRWSAFGDGQWIAFDLGKPRRISSVEIAFYAGDLRTSTFDLETSSDGLVWTPVLVSQVSSGATQALEVFPLADLPVARYVRYLGHGNSVSGWNSLTEVKIQTTTVTDTDADGMPDSWEQQIVDADATDALVAIADVLPGGDFDGDDQTNLEEYYAGSNPIVFNAPGDSDNDGLPDGWEVIWFDSLSQGPAGDPDGDGFSNLEECEGGSDPTSPTSRPGDSDGDGLRDEWETSALGNLDGGAYDDPDSDGSTNLAEFIAGTDPLELVSKPSWNSPAVAYLGGSTVAANACIMPSSAIYGRAINGLSFQDQILYTFQGYQYTAFYDSNGTTQRVVLARRTIDGTTKGAWETFQTDSEFTHGDEEAWDAHNVVALGICETDGSLHLAWDHHGHTLRYRRSIAGLCTTNPAAWGAGMLQPEQDWLVAADETVTGVTYPQFVSKPDGGLALNWRTGASGNGDQVFCSYDPAAGHWSGTIRFLERTGDYNGSTSRCAYLNGFDYAPNGSIHVSWTWREGAGSSNHDICYAWSDDGGVRWKNTAGTVIADTSTGGGIDLNSAGIVIKPLDLNQLLINQQTQCVDSDGRVHVMMLHRREDPGFAFPNVTHQVYSTLGTAYYHYFLEPGTGKWQQRRIPPDRFPVGSRPAIGYDPAGNVYAAFVSYDVSTDVFPGYASGRLAIARASKESRYSDWKVLQTVEVPNAFTGEPLIDQPRLVHDRILSVYLQENSAASSSGATPLHVYEFAVGVGEPTGSGQSEISMLGDHLVVTTYGETGATYQLQTSPTLQADWTSLGESLGGNGGLLAVPDGSRRVARRRFYRFEVTSN
ncbi:BNR-4 repeat-containing protein [Haloferula sargassicola]|uniref:F5/8 type C domain-containing protein n=1 Tax=Haloferula sargassicola TaxID=490096 RepID=A0ABP9URW7_9BACT